MAGFYHQRSKRLTAPFIAARSEGPKRITVVALPPCDQSIAAFFANLQKVLSRQFQRRFDGFRTARYKVNPVKITWRFICQKAGQLFRGFRCEKSGMCVGEIINLPMHCVDNRLVSMPKTGNRRSA